jgi:hypothetical protein
MPADAGQFRRGEIMEARRTAEDPRKRQLRYLAWSIALALAVLAWFEDSSTTSVWLRLAAAAIFAVGTVLPGLFRQPFLLSRWVFRRVIAALMSRSRSDKSATTHAGSH